MLACRVVARSVDVAMLNRSAFAKATLRPVCPTGRKRARQPRKLSGPEVRDYAPASASNNVNPDFRFLTPPTPGEWR
jgi:hypothetical protein